MDPMQLFRLTIRILCDCVPDQSVPVYLASETADNEESVFRGVVCCAGDYPIVICDGNSTAGYPGGKIWAEQIKQNYGVVQERIHLVPLAGPLNTKTELKALADYVKERGWKEVAITAPPFHQVRVFLTFLRIIQLAQMNNLKIYNRVGQPQPWQEQAAHSQGVLRDTRENLIASEFERIIKYTSKGDLATLDEALEYLRIRDT